MSQQQSNLPQVGGQIRLGDSNVYISAIMVKAASDRLCAGCRGEIAAGDLCCKQDESRLGSDLHWCLNCAARSNRPSVSHREGDSVRLDKYNSVAAATRAKKKGKCFHCSHTINEGDLYYGVDCGMHMRFCVFCVESMRTGAKVQMIGGAILVVLVCLVAFWLSPDEVELAEKAQNSRPQNICEHNLPHAYVLAQEAVKRTLKVPGSVDFPFLGVGDVVVTADNRTLCTYKVFSTLEAQNVLGATVERRWSARVRYIKADNTLEVDFAKVLE